MRTRIQVSAAITFFCLSFLSAQVPQGFNYQAIARGSDGKELANANIQVKLSILTDTTGFYLSGSGTYIWEEQQSVNTNSNGLFSLTFGNLAATKIQGTAPSFSVINWKQQPLFIGTKIFYGSWKNMGAVRLLTVPYAMVAEDVSGPLSKLKVTGSIVSNDSALFEVKNKDGQTVFAVYNEGVRIYVDDGLSKASGKGGFAIGSFGTAKGTSQPLFLVNADSIRGYIDTNPGKALKGGFAIGSFSPAKAPGEEYLRVTRDSTRINVTPPAKGRKGGFAIGSFSPAKGQTNNFMDMTPRNYFIGDSAGASTSGTYNSFVGYKAGAKNTGGSTNAFFGYQAGYNNLTGNSNLFVGYQTGYSNKSGNYNSFLGYKAGYSNTTGLNNTFLGSNASPKNTGGSNNTSVGFWAGYNNTTGSDNNFFGAFSGYNNTTGNRNIFLGPEAGYKNNLGNGNIFIGSRSGYESYAADSSVYIGALAGTNLLGSMNIAIGASAGLSGVSSFTYTSENIFIGHLAGDPGTCLFPPQGSNIWIGKNAGWNLGMQWFHAYQQGTPPFPALQNTLVIDNTERSPYVAPPFSGPDLTHYPLIFGNFTYDQYKRCVVINGVNNHGYTFFVNGSSASYGAWGMSDARQKKNISSISGALNKILALQGVNFEWVDSIKGGSGQQIGFIAQEALKVIPEVVQLRSDIYTMNYSAITALLVEGIKDQQKIIESQNNMILEQNRKIQYLLERIEKVESALSNGKNP